MVPELLTKTVGKPAIKVEKATTGTCGRKIAPTVCATLERIKMRPAARGCNQKYCRVCRQKITAAK